jgi:cyclic pyranopterin phosphate synthase
MDKSGFLTHDEVLRYEEMARLVKAFVRSGVRRVRITGGEPLLKRNITHLIEQLKDIDGLEEIAMTTNGVYLTGMASRLKKAGLDRVNISLDTLKKDKYASITGRDCFEDVWSGIYKALGAGLHPVKLNVVVMRGINDDEILDFARLAVKYPLYVRFIEFFSTGRRSEELNSYLVRNSEIKEKITGYFGAVTHASGVKGNGPAEYFRPGDSKGLIGFISSSSSDFCGDCNRVRVDCAGRISPCLFSGYIYDPRRMLRSGKNDEELLGCIKEAFEIKPKYNKNTMSGCKIEMSRIGG